jgi:hypothetical protein
MYLVINKEITVIRPCIHGGVVWSEINFVVAKFDQIRVMAGMLQSFATPVQY